MLFASLLGSFLFKDTRASSCEGLYTSSSLLSLIDNDCIFSTKEDLSFR